MIQDEPLIWTIRGNLPVNNLQYVTRWENTDTYIKFVEQYFDGDDLVKESAHVLMKHGLDMFVQTGNING